jgi:hypothetical protein
LSVAWVVEEDPKRLASQLVEASRDRPGWLAAFAGELESQALVDSLRRFLGVWDLSASEASRLFGVSRQALSKWFTQGVPADRLEMVADLAAATDLLVRYLKRDRIPATVRRKAERLGGRSLLDLVAAGDSRRTLEACRAMFDFSAVHG